MKKIGSCVALFALASAGVLAGCANSASKDTSAASTTTKGGAYAISTSNCTDPGAATKAIKGDIKLGYSVALSGPIASVQKFVNDGIKARVAVANAAGGVDGHKLDLTLKDDGYDPQRAKQNIDQFIQQGYTSLLTTGTGQMATTTGDQNAACVPMLGAQVAAPEYLDVQKYPWTTESLPSSDAEMKAVVSLLEKKYPAGVKVGVAVAQSDSGANYLRSLQSAINGTKISIVKTAPTTNPNDAAATLKASGAQVLFIAAVATDCMNLPVAAAKAGWKPLVVENSACVDPQSIYKPAGKSVDGAIVMYWAKQPTDPDFMKDPAARQYINAVKKVGGDYTNLFTLSGYNNTDITIDAMTKAAKSSAGLTQASIMTQARTQQYQPPLFLNGVKWQMNPDNSLGGFGEFQPLQWSASKQKWSPLGSTIPAN